ncbi:MAG: 50S ribosomal protein L17 [Candidatus Omnitrophica bacterium]|nr:50S ribosomal protein L17 [Candidatus Omnitrophota bacterium]
MRHRRNTQRLSRGASGRKALLRSLVRGLFISERITTTYVKAKEASSLADRLITLGKNNTITSKKTAISILGSKELINRLFDDIAPRYGSRQGGYTRVLQLPPRRGDGAKMALLELTEKKIEKKKPVPQKEDKKKEEKPSGQVAKEVGAEKKTAAEKPKHAIPPKAVSQESKDLQDIKKQKEKTKTEKEKEKPRFFKDLKRYFRRKSM